MKIFLAAYFSFLFIMLAIDAVWLTLMVKFLYSKHIGHLMAASPSLIPALIFYLVYALGVTVFVLLPAVANQSTVFKIFGYGALLGFMAYATYDLTNQATLKDWPVLVTSIDLAWGALLTGTVSVLAFLFVRWLMSSIK
jgi:uncharacterized membrane protein